MDKVEFLKELTNLIKLYRQQKRITFKSLSEKTNLSIKYLNSLELGKHDPSISNYFLIIKSLEIPTNEIYKILSNYIQN
ncbi:MAG: helix-turn-helix transcriptional regulator [Neisseriaceae bacterium]|jgi:transcriptional regulator with XRE-family HTH domain